ncbi:ankyrin-2-like isoform X1 [Scylla paramamosain]|uniref:ankyrin-2-like isoform X1 n=1 Tax=Scylla paramamosain TaxID=85552 RepID=UPI0030832E1F
MGSANELLLWSLIEKSEEDLGKALEKGANVNLLSPTGSSPLHVAALRDSAWLIDILLKYEARVDQKDNSGFTPLMVAALNGKTDAARVLLSNGADPNIKRPSNGQTALHLAMDSRSRMVVRALVDADADINAQANDRKFTPLHLAAVLNAGELAHVLLEDPQCDVTILDSNGRTAAMVATDNGNHRLGEDLRVYAMTKSKADKELLSAVMELDEEAARKALAGGANANLCLHAAAMKGSVSLIKILLDHRIDVNQIDSLGFTPLMVAALNGNTDAVTELMANGANLNLRGRDGETALHLAMKSANLRVVNELLKKGADINAQTKSDKFTPLHFAAYFNIQHIRRVLEMHTKCNTEIVDWKSRTAAKLAEERRRQLGMLPESADGNMTKPVEVSENVYKVTSSPRGRVIVLNYENFGEKDYRSGAIWDTKKLGNLFTKMDYQVETHHNLKYQKTKEILNFFRSSDKMAQVDCAVVCVLSHGVSQDTFITSDNIDMTVDEIYSYFTDDQCPYLKGKPKLFLFNYCRGCYIEPGCALNKSQVNDDLATQGTKENSPSRETLKDYISIYATMEGIKALRNMWKGTYFAEAVKRTFNQYADVLDVVRLAEELKNYLKNIGGTTISVDDKTTKKFYLNLPRKN